MDDMIKHLMKTQERQAHESPILCMMLKERQKIEKALDNLVSALENGIFSSTTNQRLHELEKKKEEFDCNILIEQSKTVASLTESEMREYYKEALEKEPQPLINSLIKQITVFNDHLIIQFNSPKNEGPDESQGFSFYREKAVVLVPNTCSPIPKRTEFTIELQI